ncbi:hypothetical protein GCM10027566_14140 [Arachidicoccus ginsenosidivorans]|jgi:uncharacterized metal-binding protein YceD (DUF177 family)|uniref:DUF177 domain-containing protein n=1 Tax=Arachidicoccus ginsenosidivorans TaxID=496057 RepID=A0A5B8VHY3_9BACT|nr:DUF177 domain-containing protein [Arachidicoccus ginsenosidivorans]QEC71100.1 DUF177 domain-containing protein [Arachidicoccus ginsenosidivorans]
MNYRRAYEIAFVGLKPGIHDFEYKVDDRFFEHYGPQDFENCQAEIKVKLEKTTSLILLKFDISGTVDVQCDRCANTISKELWDEFDVVVKMVDEPDQMNEQEEDPDIFYIGYQESHLHLADWIYEFVNLSIPTQRFCAEDPEDTSKCNQEVIEKLDQMKQRAIHHDSSNVWKDLDKLKGLEEEDLN